MRAAEIFERWYVATVLEPAVGRGRAIRRMAELAEIRDRLLREATIAPTADVLDLGCAYGLVTWPAGEEAGHAFGADPDPALIAAGMTVPATGATLLAADPDRLPLPAASFDVVLWRGTLARRPAQAREILGEAFRVLRPEGRLCFAEPAPLEARPEDPAMRDLWARLRAAPGGLFHRDGLETIVESAGFTGAHAKIERRRTTVEDERAAREVFEGAAPGSVALGRLLAHAGMPETILRVYVETVASRAPVTLEVPEVYVTAEKPRR
ncbi:MAG TPA: class I SAM-dependent methyltransferase [Actinomycetota bacterium]|nr:class I SAM-dependent methyltransferase [Actinomycetota bacterium]